MIRIIAMLLAACIVTACQTTAEREKEPITTTEARLDISGTGLVPTSHSVKADDGPTIYRESHQINGDNLFMFMNLNYVSANRSGFKMGPGLLASWAQNLEEVGFQNTGRSKEASITVGDMQYATSELEGNRCFVFVVLYNPIGPFYRGYFSGAYCLLDGNPQKDAFTDIMNGMEVSLY